MFIPKGPKTVMYQEFSSRGISSKLMMRDSLIPEPCKSIWEDRPLILCDAHIIQAVEDVGIEVDVSKKITDILQMYPGPVKCYFRVDRSRIDNVIEKLNEWFEMLRRKQVEEVVYVNCNWPFEVTEFPIDELDCKYLQRVSLCFVRISDPCLSNIENLTSINLSCCSINTRDLHALSYECKKLKELGIAVYEGDVIRIYSTSLEFRTIWKTGCALIMVPATPMKPSLDVGVLIEDGQALTYATFNLSTQSLSIYNMRRKMENMPLPNLKRLVLRISFKAEVEKKVLLKLMKSSITLTELILWRNGDIYPCECLNAMLDDWSGVQWLNMHEITFAKLILEADVFQDDSVFTEVKRAFEKIIRVSTGAIIKCQIGLSNGEHFFS
ncbi:hypothetical protein BS78_02G330500 [Paspalum vaginatum]|nr:hypothetical protein BS78_02G330500 [Paspalum vaginatum]